MNDVGFPVERVLEGVEAAAAAGLTPIKINMVVQRGVNEGSIIPMAGAFRGTGHIVRFIEYMDVGHTNGLRLPPRRPRSPPGPTRRGRSSRQTRTTGARSRSAGATETAVARSASSP